MTPPSLTLPTGRLPATPSKPRLRLARSLLGAAPVAPVAVDYLSSIDSWPMYRNDLVGDCTCAAAGHHIQTWTQYADGDDVKVTEAAIIKAYSEVTGYDLATGANDNGAVMQEVLSYWRKTGIGGRKILAFAEVDLADQAVVDEALSVFGGLYVGAWLPTSAATQLDAGKPWSVSTGDDATPGSWGGHCVQVGRYDQGGSMLYCTTWGKVQPLTRDWFVKYVDEAWVIITEDWVNAQGQTPGGLDLYGLGGQFAALTGEPNPFPQPTPAPVPVPPVPTPDADHVLATAARAWIASGRVVTPRHVIVRKALQAWLGARGL